jgi:hypothetical protein
VNTVMNLRVPQNAGNFLSSWGRVGFSGRTLLHGVSQLALLTSKTSKVSAVVSQSYQWVWKWVLNFWPFLAVESSDQLPGPAPLHSIIDLPLPLRIPTRPAPTWLVTFPVIHKGCMALRHARKAINFILPASTFHR